MVYSSIIRGVHTKGKEQTNKKNTKLTGFSGLGLVVVGSLFHLFVYFAIVCDSSYILFFNCCSEL